VGECYSRVTDGSIPIAYFFFTQAWVVLFRAILPIRSRTTHLMISLAAAMLPL
jgi:hypothetical protein